MDDLPSEFWQGVEQFNQQDFYACHDTLEAIWINALPSDKNFFQGILQIAVALYHLGNENWRGAVILLGEGTNRLTAYPSDYGKIDLEQLIEDSRALLTRLQATGPKQISAIAQQLINPPPPLDSHDPEPISLRFPIIKRL